MTTVNGSTVQHWRAVLDYSTSQSNTAVSITAAASMQSVAWGYDVGFISGSATVNGQSAAFSGKSFKSGTGATVKTQMASKTVSVARSTSAQKVTVGATVKNASGYHSGTSTATATVTVPALASYTVSFNANGGSGAPAAQKKWYGRALTLSSTKPTRANYSFQGWATSASSSTVAYKPGASYTGNAALSLYAVWKLDYRAPSFTSASAYRVASSGATEADPTGAYAFCSFGWKVDTSLSSSNALSSLKIEHRAKGASAWTAATASGGTSGASGTATASFAAAAGTSHEVRCTVTDTSGNAGSTVTITRSVPVASVPLQVRNGGQGVGVLAAAPETGIRLGGPSIDAGNGPVPMSDFAAMLDNASYVKSCRVLWSGGPYYMAATHTVTLSEKVSQQAHGIVLHWQAYLDGAKQNYDHCFRFIPKTFRSGYGTALVLANRTMNNVCVKYIYVSDDHLTGHADNSADKSTATSGITKNPKYFVLTEVLGV